MDERLLTVIEAAQFLTVSESHVYVLVEKKDIPHFRLGKRGPIRFSSFALKRWLQERPNPPAFHRKLTKASGQKTSARK